MNDKQEQEIARLQEIIRIDSREKLRKDARITELLTEIESLQREKREEDD